MKFSNLPVKEKIRRMKSEPIDFEIGRKAQIVVGALLGLTIIYGLFFVVKAVSDWFDSNQMVFQRAIEIKIQSPVLVKPRELLSPIPPVLEEEIEEGVEVEVSEKKETVPNEVIAEAKNSEILWKVYRLESSAGKNVNCPVGKYNGFGYAQNKHQWVCYDSFEEVVGKVDRWFSEKLETRTLAQALCYYNQGLEVDSCEYSRKFMNL